MREEKLTLELTRAEVAILAAALGNTNRENLHGAISEDYGEEVANNIMELPENCDGLDEILAIMGRDLTESLYNKMDGLVREGK